MAASLSPCPYCHSEQLHFVHHLLTHAVCCEHCGACGPSQRDMDDAVNLWNIVAQCQLGQRSPALEQAG
ncbi:Lar family restriction alleviation protein [Simiduia aestuariiviva]|uniref:Restriction alleviation protein, Lar family n=1 Tax=Simiduia aestuariiviva TaxID=1510459 RepID=A0A839UNF7_9GAMM|nr:Lar family restriction alleviation protein [Simiduia aestuariiviva]MBB3169372.1 hypothetical protein [Simiduia aestuariiviva]